MVTVSGKSLGAIHSDAVPIAIRESVVEQILEYSEHDVSREVGGFLIGRLTGTPEIAVVEAFSPATCTISKAGSLTFTHDTWSHLTSELEERFPGQKVLGWQHTHPGMGIFLSAYDLFIHRHFFREPWQMALVVDPQRQELGFFQWRGGEIVDCGFLCLTGD